MDLFVMRWSILLICCLLLAGFGTGMVSAEAEDGQGAVFSGQPQLPHSFYGTIEAAGSAVPAGVPVEVRAEGITTGLSGNPIHSRQGGYGSPDPMIPRLEVQGMLASGTPLTFFVGGVTAEVQAGGPAGPWTGSYPFSPGEVTELNLRVGTVVTPDPGYRESIEPTIATTLPATVPAGGVNPSTDMMLVLISILVVLGIVALYLGRRAEKTKKTEGGREETGDAGDRQD